jgi:hypothetical protein
MVAKKTSKRSSSSGRKSTQGRKPKVEASKKHSVDEMTGEYREKINQYYNLSRDQLSDWYERPASKYVLASVAVAALIPLAIRLFRKYPEISEFVTENLDSVEDKLKDFRKELSDEGEEARH